MITPSSFTFRTLMAVACVASLSISMMCSKPLDITFFALLSVICFALAIGGVD